MSESGRSRIVLDAVGLAAVVTGLVFVGFEIRQNTAATRAATQQAIFESTLQAHWGVMGNERLRELMIRAREDPGWVAATPETSDHILIERFYQQRFNSMENVFYHHAEGTLDDRIWKGWEGWILDVATDPLFPHYWTRLRSGYMPDFVQYMESAVLRAPPP